MYYTTSVRRRNLEVSKYNVLDIIALIRHDGNDLDVMQ